MHKVNQPEDPRRKNIIYGLGLIFLELREYPHPNLDDGVLTRLQIEVSTSLEDAQPKFFAPFDRESFEVLWTKAESWAKSDPEFNCVWPTFYLHTNYAHACHLSHFVDGFCGRYPDQEKMLTEHGPWEWRMYVSLASFYA